MSEDLTPYLNELTDIFKNIDKEYTRLQEGFSGFSCDGCRTNCCTTVFYHYTLIEDLFVSEGISMLSEEDFNAAAERAMRYCEELDKHPGRHETLSIMCPLNVDEKCIIYENRPLICRIHGLPSSVNNPIKGKQTSPGCRRFSKLFEIKDDTPQMDRTMFYTQLATLEGRLRKVFSYTKKYKKTIAEMVKDCASGEVIDL